MAVGTISGGSYGVARQNRNKLAILGFLAPNFFGFAAFLIFPVLLSLYMAFTNWSLKPAVGLEFVGLRNFSDLLWVRPLTTWSAVVLPYVAAALGLAVGMLWLLWSVVTHARGARIAGLIVTTTGVAALAIASWRGAPQGVWIAGLAAVLCGLVTATREGSDWRAGVAAAPALLLALSAGILFLLQGPMWTAYEPRDLRFWQYFYNTIYLMLGLPVAVLGALGFALLLNQPLPTGPLRGRMVGAALCLACGVVTVVIGWQVFTPDAAVLGGVLWLIAALGLAFNVVAFRTVFYLPTFTAGVALMILWKALYNPNTGPINKAFEGFMEVLGHDVLGPEWLQSVAWAKPALIIMGIWIGIGGMNMLLYLAALSNLPQHLIDAAQVDGAGRWARLRHVIWPQLAPTTFFIAIMSVIGGLQGGFEQARVMTLGGPAGSTTTLSYYIYNKAFLELDLGYAAAISWILFAIIFIATAINWQYGKDIEVD